MPQILFFSCLFLLPTDVFAGFDVGPIGNNLFWLGLVAWSALFTAYLIKQRKLFVSWGRAFMGAFIPQSRKRHIVVPTSSYQASFDAHRLASITQKTPARTAAVVQPFTEAITQTKKDTQALIRKGSRAVAQHAHEAVLIYKHAIRDILKSGGKGKKVKSPAVQKEELRAFQKVIQQQVQKQLTHIFTQPAPLERPVPQVVEEMTIVPEPVAPQLAYVAPQPVPEPVIGFTSEDEVRRYERMREQALQRAHRAVMRARNAQEGMPPVLSDSVIAKLQIKPDETSHVRHEESFEESFASVDATTQSAHIADEVQQFKARVQAVEAQQRIQPKAPEAPQVHKTSTPSDEKASAQGTTKTQDVISLDTSSGTPRLVLTRIDL